MIREIPDARGTSALGFSMVLAAILVGIGCSSPDPGPQQKDANEAAVKPETASKVVADAGQGDWSNVQTADGLYNLLLISLDTTRRDHLSCYGFEKPTTPVIDRIAEDGILFENACTPVPLTLPAHATMLTGLYPFQHGVRHNGSYVLADSFTTLPELLHARGYATGAVVSAFTLEHRYGLTQGFDVYDDQFSLTSGKDLAGMAQRSGAEVSRRALAWVDQQQGRPFFLFAHYFEPHAPYRPPEPYKSRFPGDPYSGEIACMDAAVGQLLDGLRSRALLEQTVILVVADHGEGLREHDEPTHSMFIYRTTQDVPFLLRLPQKPPWTGEAWRNRRVEGLVSLTDILPTAWNALGLVGDDLPVVAGMSLLPLVENTGDGHAWLYHETLVPDLDYGMSDLRGLQDDRWKYIRAPRAELYDLEKDPHEMKNLAAKHTDRRDRMEAELVAILSTGEPTSTPVAMDAEAIKKLRSLGYVSGARPSKAVKADPKDRSGVGREIERARFLGESGQLQQAVAILDSVLAIHPQAHMALRLRASQLMSLGRNQEALAAYAKALADCQGCPDEFSLEAEQARAYFQAGQTDMALAQVQDLLRIRPRAPDLHLLLGEILVDNGETEKARQAFAEENALFPMDPRPLIKLGDLETARGRMQPAEQAYREALRVDDQNPEALISYCAFLGNAGRDAEGEALVDQILTADPQNSVANYRKGFYLKKKGKLDAALPYFEIAVRRLQTNGTLLFEYATLLNELGRKDQLKSIYQQAIGTGNAPAGPYSNLGIIVGMEGDLQQAIQLWQQALTRNPSAKDAKIINSNISKAQEMLEAKSRR